MKTQGEIWTVAKLLELYRDGMIIKPKIQRKQCWGGATDGTTNENDFIAFVRMCGNLVNPLVFVQRGKYLLIDGNNRLNALVRCEKPPMDASVPVVIFDGITDVELIHVYEKINVTGVRLDPNDILAATASMVVYGALDIPHFDEIYRRVEGYYRANSAKEALSVELTGPLLNQFEVLLGLQIWVGELYAPARAEDPSRGVIFDVARAEYGDLREAIPAREFIGRALGAVRTMGEWQPYGKWHTLIPSAASLALCIREVIAGRAVVPSVMFYDLISMLPTKKGGVPNAQKLRLKQYAPFRVAHTPLSPAVARELVLAVLAEVDNPVECVSKKERRAPNRLYAALLHTNYILHTPRVAWSDNLDVEHIIPYSTQWAKGTKINIHRLGNLTLLDHAANLARGATMLTDGYLAALPHSGYPTSAEYCEIVDKRRLISPAAYAGMCARREAAFVDTWVRAVFG